MPFPPAIALAVARAVLPDDELQRIANLHYRDAGHGYDVFGMHPSFVALGEVMTRWFYDRYFRCEVHGAHHIPSTGPAVIAANHSGNVPIDSMMLWLAVLRNTHPPRVARPIADHFVPALPFVGTFFARGGMVGGSRGNARALLEAGEMLMIHPEGVPGVTKPYRKRYQLQKWRVGHAELAIRHKAPIVPVAIIGAEEQWPQLVSSRRLGKALGVGVLPVPSVPIPLPVRYHVHFGEPIPTHVDYTVDQADDPEKVAEAATRVRDAVQTLIEQGLKTRKGIFL